jgi:DNA gyrase subunit A
MSVSDLREMGRATQGVRVINLNEGDEIAAVAKVDVDAKTDDIEDKNGGGEEGEVPSEPTPKNPE